MNSGTDNQTLARITAAIAPAGSASQVMGCSSTPKRSRAALSTPYCPLKIQAAKKAVTVVGSTQGSKDSERSSERPQNV